MRKAAVTPSVTIGAAYVLKHTVVGLKSYAVHIDDSGDD
jgi:hypothetical protein